MPVKKKSSAAVPQTAGSKQSQEGGKSAGKAVKGGAAKGDAKKSALTKVKAVAAMCGQEGAKQQQEVYACVAVYICVFTCVHFLCALSIHRIDYTPVRIDYTPMPFMYACAFYYQWIYSGKQ